MDGGINSSSELGAAQVGDDSPSPLARLPYKLKRQIIMQLADVGQRCVRLPLSFIRALRGEH